MLRFAIRLATVPALLLSLACDEKEVPPTSDGELVSTEADDADDPPAGPEQPEDGDTEGDQSEPNDPQPDEPVEPPKPPKPRPPQAEPCADLEWPYTQACTTESGEPGVSVCVVHEGVEIWTPCGPEPACYPGDGFDQGCLGDICTFDGEKFSWYSWAEPDCATPLVLNFDGAPLRFDAASAASFDISGVGQCLSTDWPTLPWLALDRDRDGVIDSGRELFGSGTVLRSGRRASHGFEALAEHDLNRDGKIDAADPVFAELVLWSDGDGDRRGELSELVPVSAVELVAIHLDVSVRAECDDRGNCGRERARFEYRGLTGEVRSGEVVDVYLACQ